MYAVCKAYMQKPLLKILLGMFSEVNTTNCYTLNTILDPGYKTGLSSDTKFDLIKLVLIKISIQVNLKSN